MPGNNRNSSPVIKNVLKEDEWSLRFWQVNSSIRCDSNWGFKTQPPETRKLRKNLPGSWHDKMPEWVSGYKYCLWCAQQFCTSLIFNIALPRTYCSFQTTTGQREVRSAEQLGALLPGVAARSALWQRGGRRELAFINQCALHSCHVFWDQNIPKFRFVFSTDGRSWADWIMI